LAKAEPPAFFFQTFSNTPLVFVLCAKNERRTKSWEISPYSVYNEKIRIFSEPRDRNPFGPRMIVQGMKYSRADRKKSMQTEMRLAFPSCDAMLSAEVQKEEKDIENTLT